MISQWQWYHSAWERQVPAILCPPSAMRKRNFSTTKQYRVWTPATACMSARLSPSCARCRDIFPQATFKYRHYISNQGRTIITRWHGPLPSCAGQARPPTLWKSSTAWRKWAVLMTARYLSASLPISSIHCSMWRRRTATASIQTSNCARTIAVPIFLKKCRKGSTDAWIWTMSEKERGGKESIRSAVRISCIFL